MKTVQILIAFLFLFNIPTGQAQEIDEDKSVINFKTTGGGIFKVKGTFTGMNGEFNFNDSDFENSKFAICIDAATINTKNKKRDTHLKSEDFFHVENYPNICFESTEIVKYGENYMTKGQLTIHGVTKDVEIPFEFKNKTFAGIIEINRFDYNIGNDFGTLRVGETATVTIICKVN